MRKGEIFKLCWKDVDLEKRQICVRARNTKTGKTRFAPISSRLLVELKKLKKVTFENNPEHLVYGITTDADNAFDHARQKAEIEDLHFHDLRGTGITRMLRANLPAAEIMKMSGPTQWRTFMKYVKQGKEGIIDAGAALDKWNAEHKI